MIFAQHRPTTWNLFGEPWHTVEIERFPHYRHLIGKGGFREYLDASWKSLSGKKWDRSNISRHIERFEALARDCRKNGIKEAVPVAIREDGRKLLIDGNHRASIANVYGLECPEVVVPLPKFLKQCASVPGLRFGSPDGTPYQSLYRHGKRLIKGRRDDVLSRHAMIAPADLSGTVLDFGCNLGASSILAAESGAAVYAHDVPELRHAAMRLFVALNVHATPADTLKHYDCGFFFSVHAHCDITEPLSRCKVAYLETHEDGKLPDTGRKAEHVGNLGRRKLYRLE